MRDDQPNVLLLAPVGWKPPPPCPRCGVDLPRADGVRTVCWFCFAEVTLPGKEKWIEPDPPNGAKVIVFGGGPEPTPGLPAHGRGFFGGLFADLFGGGY
jgi:hypothetical protein